MRSKPFAIVVMALCVVVMTAGTALAAPVAQEPYDTNEECLECHDVRSPSVGGYCNYSLGSKVDFDVTAAVDYDAVCAKCHWEPAGTHPYHNGVWNCSGCHPGWGPTNFAAIPQVQVGSRGFFRTTGSASADGATLHALHSQSSWRSTASKNGVQCGSCHAPTDCATCHASDIDETHRKHTFNGDTGAFWPVLGPTGEPFALGVPSGSESQLNVNTAVSCSNVVCHDFSAQTVAPTITDEAVTSLITYNPPAAWASVSAAGYNAGRYRVSNTLNARATFTFTGQKIEVIGDRLNNRGKMKVTIDDGMPCLVDLYVNSTTPEKLYVAYASDVLEPGNHTIVVEVPYLKNSASKGYWIVLDAFKVYPVMSTATRGDCVSCHTGILWSETPANCQLASHTGWVPFPTHSPGNTVQANDTNFYGIACDACHIVTLEQGGLVGEHSLSTSDMTTTNPFNVCEDCHLDPLSVAPRENHWSARNTTSACASCHQPASRLAIHTDAAPAKHVASTVGCSSSGTGCHDGDDVSQVGPTTTVNNKIHGVCVRCHDRNGTTQVSASWVNLKYSAVIGKTACTGASGCHDAGNYNASTAVHSGFGGPANGTDSAHHTVTIGMGSRVDGSAWDAGGGNTCYSCHSATMAAAHATSAVANTCAGCHNSAGATGLLNHSDDVVKASWSPRTCDECHTSAAGHSAVDYHDTYTLAVHMATTGSCGDPTTCHGSADVRWIHNKTFVNAGATAYGCLAAGSDSYGPNPVCHARDKEMPSGVMSCGLGGTGAIRCHTSTPGPELH